MRWADSRLGERTRIELRDFQVKADARAKTDELAEKASK
jgi:hypothetical protein